MGSANFENIVHITWGLSQGALQNTDTSVIKIGVN
jgi:hypothetical protein